MPTFSASLVATICKITFTGRSSSGDILIPGLAAGDVPVAGTINGTNLWPSFSGSFEPVISTNGRIKQTDPQDLSGVDFAVYLVRGVL